MDETEIEELWRRVLDGDPSAEERFYHHYLPFVHRRVSWLLFSFLRSGRIRHGTLRAEDLIQATFLRLFERDRRVLRKFDPTAGARRAYVLGVATRVAQEELKRHARTTAIPPAEDEDEESETRLAARIDLRHLLELAVEHMRPSEIQILLDLMERELGYQDDRAWSNAEHQALHRMRKRLSELLAAGPRSEKKRASPSVSILARVRKLLSSMRHEPIGGSEE